MDNTAEEITLFNDVKKWLDVKAFDPLTVLAHIFLHGAGDKYILCICLTRVGPNSFLVNKMSRCLASSYGPEMVKEVAILRQTVPCGPAMPHAVVFFTQKEGENENEMLMSTTFPVATADKMCTLERLTASSPYIFGPNCLPNRV